MTPTKLFLYSILLFSILSSCSSKSNKFSEIIKKDKSNFPLIIAHRGILSDNYAENAIESFNEVYQVSKNMIIEFDVRLTQDSVYVLLHDETLDRTTTEKGLLSEKKYANLRTAKLLTNTGDTTSYTLPTFKSALQWAKGKNFLAIDAKPNCNLSQIVKYIEEADMLNQCFVICYSLEDALRYQKLNANLLLAIGFNSTEKTQEILNSDLNFSNVIALTPTTLQSDDFYKPIQKLNIPIAYGTYKELDRIDFKEASSKYEKLLNQFEIITTNRALEVFSLAKGK